MSRAIRRHHRERLFKHRKEQWGGLYKDDPKVLAKLIDTPTPCSCWMCANERRGNRLQDKTMQEVRFLQRSERA